MALESVIKHLDCCTRQNGNFSEKSFRFAVEYANTAVFNYKTGHPDIKNMGTTFVGFIASKDGGYAYHIGDSRLYRMRDNTLVQFTQDHSAEREVLPDFMQNAHEGRYSSVLTRALGTHEKVAADCVNLDYAENDILLLCSDGLYSMISSETTAGILRDGGSLEECCQKLIDAANEAGGEDNITVTLLKLESLEDTGTIEWVCETNGSGG
jgi:protein phosphatase